MGIQTAEIVAWLDLYGIKSSGRQTIYELVIGLDSVYLTYQAEKREKK